MGDRRDQSQVGVVQAELIGHNQKGVNQSDEGSHHDGYEQIGQPVLAPEAKARKAIGGRNSQQH